MTRIIIFSILMFAWASCSKPDSGEPLGHPEMHYTNMHNVEVKDRQLQRLDIDGNGTIDFSFGTLLVGDPVLQRDRLQFYAYSFIKTNLLVDPLEQTPVLNRGERIKTSYENYAWYEIASIVLAEKIIPLQGTFFWQGNWKDARYKYMPVQLDRNGKLYQGWIEITFDTLNEKLVLHRAAISKEPVQVVIAGN